VTGCNKPRQAFDAPVTRSQPPLPGLDAVPNCAQNCAREGLQVTQNHPPPANETKKNPLVNCWFTEGSRSGKRL
jgi:hypothetical protein